MSIKYISSGWKTHLKTGFPKDYRSYIDFRQIYYPPIPTSAGGHSDGTYTLITSGENRPGSHDLTGGRETYALALSATITIRVSFRPEFAYNVSADQIIWSWWIDADHYLELYYDESEDKFRLGWEDGGTFRYLETAQFDDGSSHRDIDQDMVIDCTLALGSATTSGSAIYWNRTQDDTSWSGTISAKTTNYPILGIRGRGDGTGNDGSVSINQFLIIDGYAASATEVAEDYKNEKREQVVFHFNGCGIGQTRCNITDYVNRFELEKSVINAKGRRGANLASLRLISTGAEFADDQYASFDPTSGQYNGLLAESYLKKQCPVQVETWYGNNFELMIKGRISSRKFMRKSSASSKTYVVVGILDQAESIERKVIKNAQTYSDYAFCNTSSEGASLIHVLTRLSSQERIINFLGNSSFENATITNSWYKESDVTLARVSGGLFGSYSAQASTSGSNDEITQLVLFTVASTTAQASEQLNKGQSFTFQIFMKAASAATVKLHIFEQDASGTNGTSTESCSLTNDDSYKLYSVTRKITDADSDRIKVSIEIDTNSVNVNLDGAMLFRSRESVNFFVLNTNDGSSGEIYEASAVEGVYDTCGFDVDNVADTHPWVFLPQYANPWQHLSWLADATLATYIGFDSCGTFTYRCKFKTSYSDPSSLETISAARDIASEIEQDNSNALVISGVKITKESTLQEIWNAGMTGDFSLDAGNVVEVSVANNADFPDFDTFGQYWALYGDGSDNPEQFGQLVEES